MTSRSKNFVLTLKELVIHLTLLSLTVSIDTVSYVRLSYKPKSKWAMPSWSKGVKKSRLFRSPRNVH